MNRAVENDTTQLKRVADFGRGEWFGSAYDNLELHMEVWSKLGQLDRQFLRK
jgi:hypothetical protein